MEKLPFVSIIVPVYNDGDTIELCLRTLIRQTYPAKEIVVVDDGSTDNTFAVLSKIAKEYPSLCIISTEHGGITKARNLGLMNAKGEIIFFAEGDAVYSKEYLKKAVNFLRENLKAAGVCLTGATWISKPNFAAGCIDAESRIRRKLLEEGKMKPFYAWVFRKKAYEEIGGFDERLSQAEDKDVFLRIQKLGYPIGIVAGINWRHRRDQDLLTFLKRYFRGSKTRVLFIMKHQKIVEFLKSVCLLWLWAAALILLPFYPQLSVVAILLLFAGPALYKLVYVLKFGWKLVKEKRYLFLFPTFFLLRYMATALGYTYGLIIVIVRKIQGKSIDWVSLSSC